MRKFLLVLPFAGLLAACSAPDTARVAHATGADAPATRPRHAAAAVAFAGRADIASLPDRGELLAYRHDVPLRRSRAYTWRAVDISEAHALKAIGGELVIPAPGGQPLRLRYDRHIEHPDGNWTWIGHPTGDASAPEAIITFGEKAVFGSIPVGRGPDLRLTTGGGRVWMMETDPRAVTGLPGANPTGTDALLPPRSGNPRGAAAPRTALGLHAESVSASAPTVDLLIGYTSGFATRLGGQSQANTRLTYLVDVTNQAYANSVVDAQVRLVKTVQVSYPDATSNTQALYDLTGCNESSCTQVVAALKPLHSARDQYGADAISLVRNFNDPENEGCGIAWLIGGAQTAIDTSDDYAAMSVVSDSNGMGGAGSFPDNGYVCRDETLAHELGHNMGSAHDRVTARGDDGVLQSSEYGRYTYSFGYKTGSDTGNFYTIMAYGDSGQARYRVFSNPRITYCGGYACGIENQADNARSLQQTIPAIAGFRASLVDEPVPANGVLLKQIDVNGNGKSDLFFFRHDLGRIATWFMSGTSITGTSSSSINGAYRVVDAADFDGNHRGDLLLTSSANDVVLGLSNGTTHAYASTGLTYSASMNLLAAADVDGDGKSDILLRNQDTGAVSVWFMSGTTRRAYKATAFSTGWSFVAAADMNGDRKADLLWQESSGKLRVSLSTGATFDTFDTGLTPSTAYQLLGLGDVNGDGRGDVILHSASLNRIVVWYMNGATRFAYNSNSAPAGYMAMGKGDFDGNRQVDLVMQHPSTKAIMLLFASGSSFNAAALGSTASSGSSLMDNN